MCLSFHLGDEDECRRIRCHAATTQTDEGVTVCIRILLVFTRANELVVSFHLISGKRGENSQGRTVYRYHDEH